ncbi:hypothetical protein AB6A40_005619 [Gnathostoma spinigerum]|uniref:Glycosyl-hydrolase family 116 N-terminal domain-containing protein n=1 Tax=Gnathostoma spinigerum TaxID=75299 RepID=A0ABD6EH40_9BILA
MIYWNVILCATKPIQVFAVVAVSLSHSINQMPCKYALAVKETDSIITLCERFDPSGSGSDLWQSLYKSGQLNYSCKLVICGVFLGLFSGDFNGSTNVDELGIAGCSRSFVKAGEIISNMAEFALVWDMPIVHFGGARKTYRRRYTRLFGENERSASNICVYSISMRQGWENAIENWQRLRSSLGNIGW